jgi:hypothetical protein
MNDIIKILKDLSPLAKFGIAIIGSGAFILFIVCAIMVGFLKALGTFAVLGALIGIMFGIFLVIENS